MALREEAASVIRSLSSAEQVPQGYKLVQIEDNPGATHWDGCWRAHHDCAIHKIESQSGVARSQIGAATPSTERDICGDTVGDGDGATYVCQLAKGHAGEHEGTRQSVRNAEQRTFGAVVGEKAKVVDWGKVPSLRCATLAEAAEWMLALIDGGEPIPKPGDEVAEELRRLVAEAKAARSSKGQP